MTLPSKTYTMLLEAYNVLYWAYRVRPRRAILEKMLIVLSIIGVVPPSAKGLDIAKEENIPLGDGILIATALDNKLPVVVSNDRHVEKTATKP
jgi:hypothetical protein